MAELINSVIDASDLSSQAQEKTSLKSLDIISLEYGNFSDIEDVEVESDISKSSNINIKVQNESTNESTIESTNKSAIESTNESTNENTNQQAVPLVQTLNLQKYREKVTETSSEESDNEDDSSSTTSSSSSSSSSSNSNCNDNNHDKSITDTKITRQRKNKQNCMQSELDNLPPIEDLKISIDEVLCDPFGKIYKIVEQVVLVEPILGKPTLDLDTILFVDKGQRALGKILDVYGPVNEPHYCVRFNSSEHIQECNIKVNMTVYYCPNMPYTSILFPHELRKIKHSDVMDEDEVPVFSDDEEERNYEMQKDRRHNVSHDNALPNVQRANSHKRRKSNWQSNHPWNRNGQSRQYNQNRQCDSRNSDPTQNESYLYANPAQYSFRSNAFQDQNWSPIPPMGPVYNRPYQASYNEPSYNTLLYNSAPYNGVSYNGASYNGAPYNGPYNRLSYNESLYNGSLYNGPVLYNESLYHGSHGR